MNEFDIAGKEQISHQEKITGKSLKEIIQELFFMWYMLKNEIYPTHISKQKLRDEKKNVSMFWEGKCCYCLSLFSLLIGIISKHVSDLYYLNCFHSFRLKNKIES